MSNAKAAIHIISLCVCVCVCVYVCVRACVRACVCVRESDCVRHHTGYISEYDRQRAIAEVAITTITTFK